MRVRRELGRRTLALAQRGLLQIDDPQRAALRLMLLVAAQDRWYVDDNRADRRDTVARVA